MASQDETKVDVLKDTLDVSRLPKKVSESFVAIIDLLIKEGYKAEEVAKHTESLKKDQEELWKEAQALMGKGLAFKVQAFEAMGKVQEIDAKLGKVHFDLILSHFASEAKLAETWASGGKASRSWDDKPLCVIVAQNRNEVREKWGANTSVILAHNNLLTAADWKEKASLEGDVTSIENNIHVFSLDATDGAKLVYRYSLGSCDSPSQATKALAVKFGKDTNPGIHGSGWEDGKNELVVSKDDFLSYLPKEEPKEAPKPTTAKGKRTTTRKRTTSK